MFWFFQALLIIGLVQEAALLVRGYITGGLKRYPLLFSYIAFVLASEVICAFVDHLSPADYATTYWFFYTVRMLAEFGVLWGVVHSIFKPYPLLRTLGHLLVVASASAFILLYWAPQDWTSEPSATHFLNLIKLSALTKAVAIAGILAAARKFRIHLGRNNGGILLGFVTFYTINAVNFAAALQFGRSIYGNTLSWLGPLSYGFLLIIWNVALWKLDPVPAVNQPVGDGTGGDISSQEAQIRRLGNAVTRLLWK